MAPRKTERIMNLTICLLSTRRFLSREQIRRAVDGYEGLSDAAFERTFERDKDELRAMGVPVETGGHEAYFDDEQGYRIVPSDFALPPVEFTPAEAAAVLLASRAWRQVNFADISTKALTKLRAAGLDASQTTGVEPSVVPRLAATEDAFDPFMAAFSARQQVRFDYRKSGGRTRTRTVEPWGVIQHNGRWYLIGRDVDRDAPRMFKLARVSGSPQLLGKPGSFTVPDEIDLRALAASLEPRTPTEQALLAVRRHHAQALVRGGELTGDPDDLAKAGNLPAGFELHRVRYGDDADLASLVAAAGADALVVEPASLRALVIERLRSIAAGPLADEAATRQAATGQAATGQATEVNR